jgi:hypothetical protein
MGWLLQFLALALALRAHTPRSIDFACILMFYSRCHCFLRARFVRWDLGLISWAEVAAYSACLSVAVHISVAIITGFSRASRQSRPTRVAMGVMIAVVLIAVSNPWGQEVCSSVILQIVCVLSTDSSVLSPHPLVHPTTLLRLCDHSHEHQAGGRQSLCQSTLCIYLNSSTPLPCMIMAMAPGECTSVNFMHLNSSPLIAFTDVLCENVGMHLSIHHAHQSLHHCTLPLPHAATPGVPTRCCLVRTRGYGCCDC